MRATLRRILSLWRPHKWLGLGLAVALVLRALFTVVLALSIKLIIDRVVEDSGTGSSAAGIVALLLVGYLVSSLASVAAGYLSATAGARILADVRTAAFEHLQHLSIGYHSHSEAGDILSRFSSDVAHLQRGVVTSPTRALESVLALGMFIPVMAALEWRLTLLALVAMPVAVGLARRLTPEPAQALDDEKALIAEVLDEVHENLAAQPVIRAYGLHRRAIERFRARIDRLKSGSTAANFRVELLAAGSEFAVSFVQLTIVAAGAVMALNGDLAPGALAAFVALLGEFTWEVTVIGSEVLPEIAVAGSGIRRIDELLAAGPVISKPANPQPSPEISHGIRFDDVSFSYGDNDERQLDGVKLELPAGSVIALVGPSGSGKSTLVNLLLRFYDPMSGRVLVDDTDLKQVDPADYRAHLGVVFQDTFLFNDTLRENVRLARPGATDDEVDEAAEETGVSEFAARLPEGLSTRVGSSGRRLSAGQRQRVGIARALLRRPSLLLLDEVTSALDPATEEALMQTLRSLGVGRTVVSVTHRLQSAADADLVVVMDDGKPVEQGSFAQLRTAGGRFTEMWEKQAGFAVSADGRAGQITPGRLKAIALFADMDDRSLSILADEFVPDHFVAGEDIFQLGQPADRFHVIARGVTEVIRGTEAGDRVVAHLEDGDFFGEMAFLNDAPRNATVRAVTPTLTLSLDRNQFEALLESSPGAAEMVRRAAADRMEV